MPVEGPTNGGGEPRCTFAQPMTENGQIHERTAAGSVVMTPSED